MMRGERSLASPRVQEAVATVRAHVERNGNLYDLRYFREHEQRFLRTAQRLSELIPPAARVLDIGSHYLHLSSVMSELGYTVTGTDVPDFTRLPFVAERAVTFSVHNEELPPGGLADGSIVATANGSFDAVLFCEILEHITFNPIRFWRRVYELLETDGIVYITTPNGLQLLAVLGTVWNATTLRRKGLRVEHIFSNVTYGHHWKEYTAGEIREYFARLSPDFDVTVGGFHLRSGRRYPLPKELLRRLGNTTGTLAEYLEAVVRLRGRTRWLATPPEFG